MIYTKGLGVVGKGKVIHGIFTDDTTYCGKKNVVMLNSSFDENKITCKRCRKYRGEIDERIRLS